MDSIVVVNYTILEFCCVEIPFSIATLSNLLGAQRQSVSTIFNKLIKTGKLIKYGKSSYIIS